METMTNHLRQIAKEFNESQSEKRILILHDEVRRFVSAHAHMGHYATRFDVFWDNNKETRKVCKMLWEEDILSSVTNFEGVEIKDAVLRDEHPDNFLMQPNTGIESLYLSWR